MLGKTASVTQTIQIIKITILILHSADERMKKLTDFISDVKKMIHMN